MSEVYGRNGLRVRQFGIMRADLDVDFRMQPRPRLVTQILAACAQTGAGTAPPEPEIWNLTVGERTEYLLAVAGAGGSGEFEVTMTCPAEACRRPMETTLSLAELSGLPPGEPISVPHDGALIPVRRPTGRDQLAWLSRDYPTAADAVRAMSGSLLPPEVTLTRELTERVDQALGESDPLVNFTMQVTCPHCGAPGSHEIDLETLALRELRRTQTLLLQAVHRLAAYYHWSEEEILALPPWRREYYLAQIEKEAT